MFAEVLEKTFWKMYSSKDISRFFHSATQNWIARTSSESFFSEHAFVSKCISPLNSFLLGCLDLWYYSLHVHIVGKVSMFGEKSIHLHFRFPCSSSSFFIIKMVLHNLYVETWKENMKNNFFCVKKFVKGSFRGFFGVLCSVAKTNKDHIKTSLLKILYIGTFYPI